MRGCASRTHCPQFQPANGMRVRGATRHHREMHMRIAGPYVHAPGMAMASTAYTANPCQTRPSRSRRSRGTQLQPLGNDADPPNDARSSPVERAGIGQSRCSRAGATSSHQWTGGVSITTSNVQDEPGWLRWSPAVRDGTRIDPRGGTVAPAQDTPHLWGHPAPGSLSGMWCPTGRAFRARRALSLPGLPAPGVSGHARGRLTGRTGAVTGPA
jgi:hypothetical protein